MQETWLKAARSPSEEVLNAGAWLTAIVTRASLDRLRRRRRDAVGPFEPDLGANDLANAVDPADNPEQATMKADQVGVALLVVLERLSPLKRVAFVLHDVFDVAFDEISALIERSPEATRQLASRARSRVRGTSEVTGAGVARHRELARAFVHAAKTGDMAALLGILDPDVVLNADETALQRGPGKPLIGAEQVAGFFYKRAAGAHVALVGGSVGFIVAPADRLLLTVTIEWQEDRITKLHGLADSGSLAQVEIALCA